MKDTKQSKLLAALNAGREISPKQIMARYSTTNPSAMISHLRDKLKPTKFEIRLNEHVDTKGRVVNKYKLVKETP